MCVCLCNHLCDGICVRLCVCMCIFSCVKQLKEVEIHKETRDKRRLALFHTGKDRIGQDRSGKVWKYLDRPGQVRTVQDRGLKDLGI